MNKIFLIFLLCANPAFALVVENANNLCDVTTLNSNNANAKLYPVYNPNTYTCNAGYFLPPNTDGCRACPSGYTCAGGTFVANNYKVQGITSTSPIIKKTTDNFCAANIVAADKNHRAKLAPIFVPNDPDVITVYFNNNGQIETTTCDADGDLTLPEPPTRVGYTFAGWKVHTEE